MNNSVYKVIINILKISCFFLFLGRGLQFLAGKAPFRTLFWDEELLSGVVAMESNANTFLDSSIVSFSCSLAVSVITGMIVINGIIFLAAAVSSLFVAKGRRSLQVMVGVGGVLLVVLSLLQFKESGWKMGMFLEHAGQMIGPWLLLRLYA